MRDYGKNGSGVRDKVAAEDKKVNQKKSTIEEKKKFLMLYQKETRRVKRLQEQLEELRSDKIFPSMKNDGMPHGNNKKDMSDYVVKMEEIEAELMRAKHKRICVFQKVQKAIEEMEEEQEKDLLTYRYLKGMKWEKVAVEMGYSWRKIHYIHSSALEHLKIGKSA